MAQQLTGRTRLNYGSAHRHQTLAGATLIFYPYDRKQGGATGDPGSRWGWQPLKGGEAPDGELGRAEVGADGSYRVDLPIDAGQSVVVAAEVERLAYAPATGKRAIGLLGTGIPRAGLSADQRTDQTTGQEGLRLDIELGKTPSCALFTALDLWLVAGRVTDCDNKTVPIPAGAEVTAFDRDLTQDDTLGSDFTDLTGSFEIFFTGETFRKIPSLPPPWDAIQPHELFEGPDVYFRIEYGGTTVLDEPPSTGRQSGRENRSNCSYFELCAQPPEGVVPAFVTLWDWIGNLEVPDTSGLGSFDADGLVSSGKQALSGHLDFRGTVSKTWPAFGGSPVSYRFVFAEWSDLTTAPAYPADYQPLTATHITGAAYGSFKIQTGPSPWDVTTHPVSPAPDTNGWIAVEQNAQFDPNSPDRMVQVDSTKLVPPIDVSGPEIAGAGQAVPPSQRDRPRKFSFVLEVKTTTAGPFHQPVPVTVHINNSAAFLRMNLQELESAACNPVAVSGGSITIHPKYTVAHPYLTSYSITMQRQGGTTKTLLTDSFGAHGPLWTDADGEFATIAGNYTDVQPCSYRVWISCSRRLNSGYGGVGGTQTVLRTFCTP